MRNTHTRLLMLLAIAVLSLGSMPAMARTAQDSGPQAPRAIKEGKKMDITGVVVSREADSFHLKNSKAETTIVVINDQTKVEISGEEVSEAQKYELRKLVGGLIVYVEGHGDANGNLVADHVKITKKDFRNAMALANKLAPVEGRVTDVEGKASATEANQATMSGQMDENAALAALAKQEAERANTRISALDNYTVSDTATVTFDTNKYDLSPEAMKALDDLAAKAQATKGYAIEITGHTDATGDMEKNHALSERRADSVTRYLTDKQKIPLHRIVTPLGYGSAIPTADNTSPEGRDANRRVEVKLMIQGGVSQ